MSDINLDEYYHTRLLKNHMEIAEKQYNQFIKSQAARGIKYRRKLDEIDFHKLASDFLETRNPNVPDNTTWATLIGTYLTGNLEPDKEFIIPVEWSVYSTVVVKGASSLKEARMIVENNLNDIPLPNNAEYVEESYHIQADSDEDLEIAQDYHTRGVLLDFTGSSISFERLC